MSTHQPIPINVSQGKEAQAADVSSKQMHTAMSAKPRYDNKKVGAEGNGLFWRG